MVAGPWRAVSVLGITQIIAWGTIFYSPVLTAPLIVAETGWSLSFVMGGFSLGLLIAGLVSPFVGRSIDRYGGHVVMTAGALISALGLLGLAQPAIRRCISRSGWCLARGSARRSTIRPSRRSGASSAPRRAARSRSSRWPAALPPPPAGRRRMS